MKHIAEELLYYRDLVKKALGRKYRSRMNDLSDGIRQVARSNRESNLSAAMRIAEGEQNPPLTIQLIAAAVEMEARS